MAQKTKATCTCDLSETDARLIRELLDTYQGVKMMSRLIRWLFLLVLVCVVDVANLLDNLGRISAGLRKGLPWMH